MGPILSATLAVGIEWNTTMLKEKICAPYLDLESSCQLYNMSKEIYSHTCKVTGNIAVMSLIKKKNETKKIKNFRNKDNLESTVKPQSYYE